MFRELYKQANDEIKGDREILDRAFLQAAQPKKTKSKTKIFYSFATSAVAAVMIVGALFVNSEIFFEKTMEKTPEEKETAGATYAKQDLNNEDEEINVLQDDIEDGVVTQEKTEKSVKNAGGARKMERGLDTPAVVNENSNDDVNYEENGIATFSLGRMSTGVECDDSFTEDVLMVEEAAAEIVEETENAESFSYMYDKNNYIGVTEGFRNVEMLPVTTKEEAVARAMEECDGDYVATEILRDDIEKVWKVSLENAETKECVAIYIDFDGKTVFIVSQQ